METDGVTSAAPRRRTILLASILAGVITGTVAAIAVTVSAFEAEHLIFDIVFLGPWAHLLGLAGGALIGASGGWIGIVVLHLPSLAGRVAAFTSVHVAGWALCCASAWGWVRPAAAAVIIGCSLVAASATAAVTLRRGAH